MPATPVSARRTRRAPGRASAALDAPAPPRASGGYLSSMPLQRGQTRGRPAPAQRRPQHCRRPSPAPPATREDKLGQAIFLLGVGYTNFFFCKGG
jgi:hypothetical protein